MNSVQANQIRLELGVDSAGALTSLTATGRESSQYQFDIPSTHGGGGFYMTKSTSNQMNFSDNPFGHQLQAHPDGTSYNTHEGHSNYDNRNFYYNIQNEFAGYQQNSHDVMHHGQDGGSFYQNESTMPGNIPSSINSSDMLAFLEDGLTHDAQLETDSRSDLDGPPFEIPENSQARDLFLPEPCEYDSDDGLSYCDKPREDDHESDHDDDDDIEGQSCGSTWFFVILNLCSVDEASPSEDEAAAAALRTTISRANGECFCTVLGATLFGL